MEGKERDEGKGISCTLEDKTDETNEIVAIEE